MAPKQPAWIVDKKAGKYRVCFWIEMSISKNSDYCPVWGTYDTEAEAIAKMNEVKNGER